MGPKSSQNPIYLLPHYHCVDLTVHQFLQKVDNLDVVNSFFFFVWSFLAHLKYSVCNIHYGNKFMPFKNLNSFLSETGISDSRTSFSGWEVFLPKQCIKFPKAANVISFDNFVFHALLFKLLAFFLEFLNNINSF